MPFLRFTFKRKQQVLEIPAEGITIGREKAAGVCALETDMLSRKHFAVRPRGGVVIVEDLGSSNGTFVDGQRLQQPLPLRKGSKIVAGSITFEFSREPFPAAQGAVPGAGGAAKPAARQATPGQATIYLLGPGGAPSASVALQHGLMIGRQESCGLRLDVQDISGQHCQFTQTGSQWVVSDLGSSNGTWIHDRSVKAQAVKRGDLIRLGATTWIAFDDPNAWANQQAAPMQRGYEAVEVDSSKAWTAVSIQLVIAAVVMLGGAFLIPSMMGGGQGANGAGDQNTGGNALLGFETGSDGGWKAQQQQTKGRIAIDKGIAHSGKTVAGGRQ